ncbi:hypothetical protein PIB30_020106 [Stylosanthes scabra]|uniref:Uncharacterized protein n=1 Tax=Stylosanthes scabra TaxID=79078 RepID=A0ABU6W7Z6_9FABA|nr:hypothetical protein [Stylosanthes scabra]
MVASLIAAKRFGYPESNIAALWYKDLEIEDYDIGLRMFEKDSGPNDDVEGVVGEAEARNDQVGSTAGKGEPNPEEEDVVEDVHPPNESVTGLGEQDSHVEHESGGLGKDKAKKFQESHGAADDEYDSDDEEYVPYGGDTDSANDVYFTNTEKNLDLGDNFFNFQTNEGDNRVGDKGKNM